MRQQVASEKSDRNMLINMYLTTVSSDSFFPFSGTGGMEGEKSRRPAKRDCPGNDANMGSFGAARDLLGLITFYTLAKDKLQAWQIPDGTKAAAAAGRIHSDMEAGFIRAEVTTVGDLISVAGNMARLRVGGRLRAEGRDHVVRDGEVITFLFR